MISPDGEAHMPHEHSENVARHFAKDWQAYDQQIRQVIPHYDQALTTMVEEIGRAHV